MELEKVNVLVVGAGGVGKTSLELISFLLFDCFKK